MSLVIGTVLTLSPILTALGLLILAEWRDRRRATVVAWQVRLTDAISTELGGVVAPVVSKPVGARWRIAMHVPVARPALVSRILAISHATLRDLQIARYELVLTPERPGESPGSEAARLRVARVPLRSAAAAPRIHGGALTAVPAGRVRRRVARPRKRHLATR